MRTRRCDEGGFTLLELLMVVIIIAILASIALPQYMRVSERSRASEALAVIGAIRSSELRFKAQDAAGAYTTDLNTLDIEVPGFGTNPASTMWTYAVGGAGAGSNAQASRIGFAKTIDIDLDSGALCSSDAAYGLKVGGC